jgi:Fic family protein
MRKPALPPPQDGLWQKFGEQAFEVLGKVIEPTVRGRYLHWDKLRRLEPPEGLTSHEWWFGLKVLRAQSRRIPLVDVSGSPFRFNLPDPLPECLHHVDSLARGVIQQPEPVTNPETRDRYLVRSLIEESITSSQLEGASTTREVAKEMIREGRKPRDRSERMILNNYRTMQHILELKDQSLTRDMVFEIHRIVTDGTLDDPSGVGRFRRPEEEVVVGDDFGEVFHVPPPAGELERRIAVMCDFANGRTPGGFIHPMVRSMILHFWLAYDHPFVDGNGRTARALLYWSMLKQGYRLFEYISISNIILKRPAEYGRAFLYSETDENDLTYFLLYHAEVVRKAIDELHHDIESRTKQLAEIQEELRGLTHLNHRQRDLVSHALRHPGQHYTIEYHRNTHNVVYETARSDMMDLADRGLLRRRKVGKVWFFTPSADMEERLRRMD